MSYEHLQPIADGIVQLVKDRDASYGSSWKQRGGVGAFMMLARKWDRIETGAKARGWDIFRYLEEVGDDGGDDLRDLIGYLLLVLDHVAVGDANLFASRLRTLSGSPERLAAVLGADEAVDAEDDAERHPIHATWAEYLGVRDRVILHGSRRDTFWRDLYDAPTEAESRYTMRPEHRAEYGR